MRPISIREAVAYLAGKKAEIQFVGNDMADFDGFSSLGKYRPDTITWAKYAGNLTTFVACAKIKLLVAHSDIKNATEYAENVIYTKEPKRVFFSLLEQFYTTEDKTPIRGAGSYVSEKAGIGRNVRIGGSGCHICDDVEIGDNTVIGNNVSIECKTHIGAGTHIGSGTVIGSVGFGFYRDGNGKNHRAQHFGGVWIGNDVEIGENCVVNRGTLDDTYIGNNVKIEALRQIAHNVTIGDNCIVLGLIGGSCTIGEDSYIAPLAFVKNQVSVGKHCMVNVGVFLTEDLPDGYVAHKNRVMKLDYSKLLHM